MSFIANTQTTLKNSSSSLGLLVYRSLSAIIFAYSLTLIGRGLISYGMIAFWLVFTVAFFVFLKLTKGFGFLGVTVVDLILFLTGLLLRMYVLVAPGA